MKGGVMFKGILKYFSVATLSLVLLSACGGSPDFELTQGSVNALIDSVELAIKNKDANAVASHFTSDAVITMSMPSELGGDQTWSIDEYRAMLESGWSAAMPMTSTHEMKDLNITIHDANNAFVTDTMIEVVSMNGNVIMSTRTEEETVVVVENGSAKIKSVRGKMSMQ